MPDGKGPLGARGETLGEGDGDGDGDAAGVFEGGGLAVALAFSEVTTTVSSLLEVLKPLLSVTATVTMKMPVVRNVWLVVTPEATMVGVPSPKDHAYDMIVPSLSTLPAAVKLTVKGIVPEVEEVAVASAVGYPVGTVVTTVVWTQ